MELSRKNDYKLMHTIALRLLNNEQKETLLNSYRHIKVNKCINYKIDNHYVGTVRMSNDIDDYLKRKVG